MSHTIRLAVPSDVEPIRHFIDAHWKKDHILARDPAFFAYEHVFGDRVNFALALDDATGAIAATLGFLKCVEPYLGADAFTVIWKVQARSGDTTLGLKLLRLVEQEVGFASVSSVGINAATVPIYEYLGFKVGALRHHYLLNPRVTSFRIARVVAPPPQRDLTRAPDSHSLREIAGYEALRARVAVEDLAGVPRKDGWYVRRRYFEHPVYAYRVFAVESSGRVAALLVARDVSANGAKALRVVDLIGDDRALGGVRSALRAVVVDGGYEYADLYEHGLDEGAVAGAGLTRRAADDPNVIPNYFSPFVQENSELLFFTSLLDARFLRGDCDQDRPS